MTKATSVTWMGVALLSGTAAPAQQPPPAPGSAPVTPSIVMVRVYVADMAKSERFYEEVLNMRVAGVLSEREHALKFPGPNDAAGVLLLKADPKTPQANGSIVVRVGDVDAVLSSALAQGANVVRPAQSGPVPNTRYAMFSDLDGTIVEVTQFTTQ
jgi:predicted enzyme related to lactoylglutathione lyase